MKANDGKKKPIALTRGMIGAFVFLFAGALAGAGAGTFAWFEIVSSASVEQINIGMDDITNFEIGVKGDDGEIHYYHDIDDAVLSSLISSYSLESSLDDMSSGLTANWLTPDFDFEHGFPSFYSHSNAHSHAPTLQFEFYFRSTYPAYLYLDEGTSIRPRSAENAQIAQAINHLDDSRHVAEYDVTGQDLDQVTKVVRVSMLSDIGYTIYAPDREEKALLAGPLDENNDHVYDAKDGKEFVYGYYDGEPNYLPPSPTATEVVGRPSAFNSGHAAGVAPIDEENPGYVPKVEESMTLEELLIPEGGSFDPASHPFAVTRAINEPTRVVLSIYAEGWDRLLTEAVSSGCFTLNLSFKGLMDPTASTYSR